jgi:hypothetical protein
MSSNQREPSAPDDLGSATLLRANRAGGRLGPSTVVRPFDHQWSSQRSGIRALDAYREAPDPFCRFSQIHRFGLGVRMGASRQRRPAEWMTSTPGDANRHHRSTLMDRVFHPHGLRSTNEALYRNFFVPAVTHLVRP